MKPTPLHLNIPQITNQLIAAPKSYHIWGRGTGKTTGILAPWYIQNARLMPRGQHGIIGRTFQQLLTRTMPPIIEMWARMGYHEGQHFIFGKEPPPHWKKMWNWTPPYTKPLDSRYAIYWFNGAVQILISQDRIGSANGLSLVTLGGDEARLLIKDRLDEEIIPTLRGNRSQFGHLPAYRSECYTTDMPTQPSAKWILDMADQMDESQIQLILQLQLHVNQLQKQLIHTKGKGTGLQKRITKFQKKLTNLRLPRKTKTGYQHCVYYSEASALENIDALGPEYIADMRRTLSDTKYRTSILNQKITKIEEGFYGNLNPEHHGTNWFNYHYIDQFIHDLKNPKLQTQDSRHDSGHNPQQPLDIAFDYGDKINCAVTAQLIDDQYRFLNAFYVLHPQLIDAVVDKFCEYYKHYPTHTVNYYYDHTALPGSGVTDFNYRLRVIEAFQKHNWRVNDIYIGKAPPHEAKYELINLILREEDPRLPKFRYSLSNCESWETSALGAGLKQTKRGFAKDKSPERDPKQPQEKAPHLSDAGDTLLFARFSETVEEPSEYIPIM